MTKKEAMQILCDGEKYGELDDFIVIITPLDIKENLRSNDYELDLEYTQDLIRTKNHRRGDIELFQGHSLEEVELEK